MGEEIEEREKEGEGKKEGKKEEKRRREEEKKRRREEEDPEDRPLTTGILPVLVQPSWLFLPATTHLAMNLSNDCLLP